MSKIIEKCELPNMENMVFLLLMFVLFCYAIFACANSYDLTFALISLKDYLNFFVFIFGCVLNTFYWYCDRLVNVSGFQLIFE